MQQHSTDGLHLPPLLACWKSHQCNTHPSIHPHARPQAHTVPPTACSDGAGVGVVGAADCGTGGGGGGGAAGTCRASGEVRYGSCQHPNLHATQTLPTKRDRNYTSQPRGNTQAARSRGPEPPAAPKRKANRARCKTQCIYNGPAPSCMERSWCCPTCMHACCHGCMHARSAAHQLRIEGVGAAPLLQLLPHHLVQLAQPVCLCKPAHTRRRGRRGAAKVPSASGATSCGQASPQQACQLARPRGLQSTAVRGSPVVRTALTWQHLEARHRRHPAAAAAGCSAPPPAPPCWRRTPRRLPASCWARLPPRPGRSAGVPPRPWCMHAVHAGGGGGGGALPGREVVRSVT